jgi:hypothetical protein
MDKTSKYYNQYFKKLKSNQFHLIKIIHLMQKKEINKLFNGHLIEIYKL